MKVTCKILLAPILAVVFGTAVVTPVNAQDLCTAGVSCSKSGGSNECQRSVMFGASNINTITTLTTPPATCSKFVSMATAPAQAFFFANRMTSASVAGGCVFNIVVRRISPVPGSTRTDTCTIDASDGLPVELMEFSIEELETNK